MTFQDRIDHRPVVLIELNEVPDVVLDGYAAKCSSRFGELLASSDRYRTVTPDKTQLDPWIAWPTLHRGVNDETHGVLRLGQDTQRADTDYPPIWRLLHDAGVPVGVWGSLFSSCETDLDGYEFFVPDVFSPHDRVVPASLQRFQAFNLDMTRASARNASPDVSGGGTRTMAELALQRRLTVKTLSRIGSQLVSEKLDKRKVSRRRNIQTEIHADLFAHTLKRNPCAFSTFYTNNVAAAMHRFWSASVPGAALNAGRLDDEWLELYADEVFAAMESIEILIDRLVRGEFGPVTVVVASALGQEEIPAENYRRFLAIADLETFVSGLIGDRVADTSFVSVPTMVPDHSLRFTDEAAASALVDRLANLSIGSYAPVETLERMQNKEVVGAGARMSHIRHHYEHGKDFKHAITYKRSDARTVHVSFQIDDYAGPEEALVGNSLVPFERLGVGYTVHTEGVNCTGQHCAEGSIFVANPLERRAAGGPVEISILDVAPSILSRFGLPIPAYMPGETSLAL